MRLAKMASLPVRGAWIEICYMAQILMQQDVSLPVRGAWIEIPCFAILPCRAMCRSPCGERGLKWKVYNDLYPLLSSLPVRGAWIEMSTLGEDRKKLMVAPRAGSVD